MLSIKNIESSKVAASYFQKDDYYAGKEGTPEATGVWFGKGAETLGLTGAVDPEAFKAMLDGELPSGEQLGTIREKGGEKEHKPGWDLTFSAPKSVSVMALVGGDERLIQAHDEAVRETLSWLEDNIAGHRKRGWLGINHEQGDNITAALFQHATSREKDAQLHTHAVVMNANQDENGKWRSLDSKPFYDHKMAAGNIYRAFLAVKAQEAGYDIERTGVDGRWELTAVPHAVIDDQSTRRKSIEAAMAERGLEGPEAAARAALMTRPSKESSNMEVLVGQWNERAENLGFDPQKVIAATKSRGPAAAAERSLDSAVNNAIDRLKDKEAVFSNAQLLQWSLAGAIGKGTVKDVEAAIGKASNDRDIHATTLAANKAWTTPGARQKEQKVIDTWADSRHAVSAPLGRSAAEKALSNADVSAIAENSKQFALNDGQRAGAMAILTQTDRFIGIEGRPGVGKTTMLGRVRPVLESQGYTVIGMAGNANAARTLQEDAGIKSYTLAKHLQAANKAVVEADSNPVKRAQILAAGKKQVWIVDESSQLGSRDVSRMMHLADRLGARVVMIGDTRQLAAIDAGQPFGQLFKAGMQRTEIDQNLRQRNQVHKDAVAQASAGDVRAAMKTLSTDTVEIENREQRLQAIVKRWSRMGAERGKTTILTARNAERIVLNEAMRDVLRKEGQLKGEVPMTALTKVYAERMDKIDTLTYKKGDVVQFGRGVKNLDIGRGEYFRVTGIDQANNSLTLTRTAAGRETETVSWNPRAVAATARNGVTLYRERATSLAPGEKIQWGLNSPDLKLSDKTPLVNGQMYTVDKVDRDSLKLVSSSGATVTVKHTALAGQHWDHALATTVYKSQGRTEDHVLVNAEANQTELFNQKAFVVAISRMRDSIKLYTDDTKRFTDNVEKKLGDKTTVADAQNESRMEMLRGKMQEIYDSWRKPAPVRQDDPAEAARRAAEEAAKRQDERTAEKTKDQAGDRRLRVDNDLSR